MRKNLRILHTADWHLGKTLEGYSRLPEQNEFLAELNEIADKEKIDLILIAGDVYDSANPSAQAERLFYDSVKKLAANGQRAVLVIAGNHDSPERLAAASSLAYEHGIILLGQPGSVARTGRLGEFEIEEAGEGYVKLMIREERAVILTLPYPSDKRLQEVLSVADEEEERRKSYSDKVKEFFANLSSHYSSDTINLAISHLYINGGIESDSERQIQLGGSFAVDPSALPPAQYIALGHLHRPQLVKGAEKDAYYSGSPLQYSKSEIYYSKSVYIVDVQAGEKAKVKEYLLRNYKPIEVWKCKNIEEALQECTDKQEGNSWVYLDIITDRVLTQAEIKEMKSFRKDIVQIRPIFVDEDDKENYEIDNGQTLKIDELFQAFYHEQRGAEPPQDIMDLFYEIIKKEGSGNETNTAEN